MKWLWYHGMMIYAGVEIISSALSKLAKKTRKGDAQETQFSNPGEEYQAFYNSLNQPLFAPPGQVFLPVWLLNNALSIWGLLQVLNKAPNTPGKREFLAAHSVFWLTYIAFAPVYFGQRSPIKGAVVTVIGFGAALVAEYIALSRLKDRNVALSMITLVPWLAVASITATTIALWNRDDWFESGPFVDAPSQWVKPDTGKPLL